MVSKYLSGKGLFLAMILIFIAKPSYGQEIKASDSIRASTPTTVNLLPQAPDRFNADKYKTLRGLSLPDFQVPTVTYKFEPQYNPVFRTDQSPLHKGEYSVSGAIKDYRHGTIYGIGEQSNLLGVGVMNYAGAGYQHFFNDRISVNIQLHTVKMAGPHFSNQSFGTSGSFSYQLSDRARFHTFGSYFMIPSSSFRSYNYGASMSFDLTERFGTEVGVQRHYNSMYGKWETVPIVTPYYKFKKFELGVDVGSILHQVLFNWLR